MGLGGIARDSIADLASLVDSSSDGNVDHDIRRRFSAGREHRPSSFTSDDKGGKLNIGGAGVDADEYLRLDEEEALEEEQKCALNDDGDIHCGWVFDVVRLLCLLSPIIYLTTFKYQANWPKQ